MLRIAIVLGLGAMIPPAMATSNRAMFAGLGLAAVYVVIRMALRNRAAPVLTIGVLGLVGGLVLVGNGLLTQIQERQSYGSLSETRFSPVPRDDRPDAGLTPARFRRAAAVVRQHRLGRHARLLLDRDVQLRLVGLALFLTFLWGTTLRTWRAQGDVDLALHSVLVVACLIIFVYGLDVMQMLTVLLVAAVLLRRRYGLDADDVGD
ncbi:hypothetical protein [Aeromicrobium sp. UC242_57]|uniref:hypothetical protein n=1 Tax=Aeromicrobium sp. UC242_57 TaxID=3374624 RepID=UPI003792C3FF